MYEVYATDCNFNEHLVGFVDAPSEKVVIQIARNVYEKNKNRFIRTHWRPVRSVLQKFTEAEQKVISHCLSGLISQRVALNGNNLASLVEDFLFGEMNDQSYESYDECFDSDAVDSTITKLKSMAPPTCQELLREFIQNETF